MPTPSYRAPVRQLGSKKTIVVATALFAWACGGGDGPTEPEFTTLSVSTTSLTNAVPTIAYTATLAASGGDGSYTWSVAAGALPAGLNLAADGQVSGIPSGGSGSFTAQVASGDGQTAQQALTIEVNEVLEVATTALRPAVLDAPHSQALEAIGGTGGYVWSLSAGSLPVGLALAPNGDITGTPTVLGTVDFDVQVTSTDGQAAEGTLALTVTECYVANCDGLQGWWSFEESSLSHGSVIADESIGGRSGTLVTGDGVSEKSIVGQVGNALDLDGLDDHVTIADDPALDLGGDFTLMAWIKPDVVLSTDWQAIISKSINPRPASLWLYADTVEVWFTPTNEYQARSVGTVTTGVWQHVAATFSDVSDEVRVYIDGALDATVTGVIDTPDTNDVSLFLGQRGDDRFYFDGGLDEVMVWSRTLTDAEIEIIYDQTR